MSPGVDVEIPVHIGGKEKRVTGINKRTTCDEIVYALLQRDGGPGCGQALPTFSLFERWREVERPLPGRTKLLRAWQAWGDEQRNVKFIVKRLSSTDYVQREKMRARARPGLGSRAGSREHVAASSGGASDGGGHRRRKNDGTTSGTVVVPTISLPSAGDGNGGLIQVILEQDNQIQEQLIRLRQTDSEIEAYETRLHCHRMKENGRSLSDSGDDSSSGGGSRRREVEEYTWTLEGVNKINLRLLEEEGKVNALWRQIQEYLGMTPGIRTMATTSSGGVDEVKRVSSELARLALTTQCQAEEERSVTQAISYSEKVLLSKTYHLQHLANELSHPEVNLTDDNCSYHHILKQQQEPQQKQLQQSMQQQTQHFPLLKQAHVPNLHWQYPQQQKLSNHNTPSMNQQFHQHYHNQQQQLQNQYLKENHYQQQHQNEYQKECQHHYQQQHPPFRLEHQPKFPLPHQEIQDEKSEEVIPDPSPSPSSVTSSSSAVSSAGSQPSRASLTDEEVPGTSSRNPVRTELPFDKGKQHSDNESNSDDTGLSSMHSSEEVTYVLETLV